MGQTRTATVPFYKRSTPVMMLGAVIFIVFVLNYFFEGLPIIAPAATEFEAWAATIEWLALILGFVSLAIRNVDSIAKQRGEWYIGAIQLVTAVAMFGGFLIGGFSNVIYDFININIKGVGQSATFAMHGWFTVVASFRALKFTSAKRVMAVIFMWFVMLSQVPMGSVISPVITDVGNWLGKYILGAGAASLMIGSGIGVVILGVRTILLRNPGLFGFRKGE